MEWINANEHEPRIGECVDIYIDWQDYTGRVCNCFRSDDGYWKWDELVQSKIKIDSYIVTHWMPLPEPPKE